MWWAVFCSSRWSAPFVISFTQEKKKTKQKTKNKTKKKTKTKTKKKTKKQNKTKKKKKKISSVRLLAYGLTISI